MNTTISIRVATEHDAEQLLAIYSPYVNKTAITFEYTVPTIEDFKLRIKSTLQRYPYLVILQDNTICGYAYASSFKPRAAYDWAVEPTIYMAPHSRGTGLGRILYTALEKLLEAQHIINLNACITSTSLPYVEATSELFHRKIGYKKVAYFTRCGYKFDRWFDVIWMEKFLSEHPHKPLPFIPFPELFLPLQLIESTTHL